MDLLNEKWIQDGGAVYSETLKNYEGDNVLICDLDEGYWDTDEVDRFDIGAMANLIAHAPDMYRMLKSMATSKKATLKDINTHLEAIEGR